MIIESKWTHHEPEVDPNLFWDITNPYITDQGIIQVESFGCGCCSHTFLFTAEEYLYFLYRCRDNLNSLIEKIQLAKIK